jgi:predicted benzoate:H+ symporter BenE
MSACILYVLYCGLTRTYDWTLAAAVGAVIIESTVYVLNGRRCPLTHWAQQYGDPTGNDLIADIFLPPSFARKIPPVCGGLFVVGLLVLVFNYLLSLRLYP